MHSAETVSLVFDLVGRGLNDCEIARMTGVPRSTVRDWRVGKVPMRAAGHCEICAGKSLDAPGAAYAYLLGMYLGDGCISRHPRAYRLRITLDSRYPAIVRECAAAMRRVRPNQRVRIGRHSRDRRCIEV